MLGVSEFILIGAVLLLLFLPSLLKSQRSLIKSLRLYLIIAVLGIIILLLSRAVITLIGKVAILTLLVIVMIGIYVKRLYSSRQ
jgi:hypothetical protein